MNGFQIDAVNNTLDENKTEIERLEGLVKELANGLGSALLFSDAVMLELLTTARDNQQPLPMHLIANKRSLDASMMKLLTKVLGPQSKKVDQ